VAWAAIGILVGLVLMVVAILCTPVRVSAQFNSEAKPLLRFRVAIFGGLLPVFSTKRARVDADATKPKRPSAKKRRKTARMKIIAYAPHMARAAPRFLCGIVRRIRLEAINADVAFGLPDPADTGALYGALTPIALLLESGKTSITLRPDFAEPAFKGRGYLAARFTPLALAPPALAFGWSVFISPRLPEALR
jgi:hypothetical protein